MMLNTANQAGSILPVRWEGRGDVIL